MFGFSGDFLTALSILIPQIENAVRYLAVECGEPVYNMNEEGIEEIKSMHAVLELEGVKESLDENLIFALNTIFCSKFGFNMRNNVHMECWMIRHSRASKLCISGGLH